MKKYITTLIAIAFLTTAAWSQTVKRTAKTPIFFVPDSVLKNKTDAERLASGRTGGYNRNTLSISPQTSPLSRIHYNAAPIDNILQKQTPFSKIKINEYKSDILSSYALFPTDLQILLQSEYDTINKETLRMEAVLQYLKNASPAYRLANFQINRQISQDMVENRKHYKKLKQKFAEIMENSPKNQNIYIIKAKNDLFWKHYELSKQWKYNWKGYTQGYHFKNVTYISVFNHEYTHLFSYYRQHLNMLKDRRIFAPDKTAAFYIEPNIVHIYQQLFDDYLNDLNRIGKGLDINNPHLLRQLNEMQDKTISI